VDLDYLPRALALYRSLEKVCPSFRLHIACVEPGVQPLLSRLDLPNAETLDVEDLERFDPPLGRVKRSRSRVEYCWTVKPVLCRYLLENSPRLDLITYVDSDLYFFDDPQILLTELGNDSIMILPHRFPSRWAQWGVDDGVYNGAWLTFRRDASSLSALAWWRDRCLEWCHDRREGGKYSDQHYLDDWPERFEGVHVIANLGAGIAPWNACRYHLAFRNSGPVVNGTTPVFYHYQSLRLVRARRGLRSLLLRLPGYRLTQAPVTQLWWTAPGYELSEREVQVFWTPYLRRLMEAHDELRTADPGFEAGTVTATSRELALGLARRMLPPGLRSRLRKLQTTIHEERA
jgi:hypothetical protein